MTPLCTSLVAQTMPSTLASCDPGSGVGVRIAFYGVDGSWDQVDTAMPIESYDEARALIQGANDALKRVFNVSV